MGELVLAAKVSHVPSLMLSELPGSQLKGAREDAVRALRELGRRARREEDDPDPGADEPHLVEDRRVLLEVRVGRGHEHVTVGPEVTGVPCHVAENSLNCVALGTGLALEHFDFFKKSLVSQI